MSQGPLPAPAAVVNDHTSTVTNRQTFTLAGIIGLLIALATTWQTMNGTATVKDAISAIKQPVVVQQQPATAPPVPPVPTLPPATGVGAEDLAILAVLRGPTYATLRKQLVEVSAGK